MEMIRKAALLLALVLLLGTAALAAGVTTTTETIGGAAAQVVAAARGEGLSLRIGTRERETPGGRKKQIGFRHGAARNEERREKRGTQNESAVHYLLSSSPKREPNSGTRLSCGARFMSSP